MPTGDIRLEPSYPQVSNGGQLGATMADPWGHGGANGGGSGSSGGSGCDAAAARDELARERQRLRPERC